MNITTNELYNLFPTPVQLIKYDDIDFFKEQSKLILDECGDRLKEREHVVSDDNLHELPQFNTIKSIIDIAVQQHATEIHGLVDNSLELKCMWSNIQSHKCNHFNHSHPNSYISGVFYLQVPECKSPGPIRFKDPRCGKMASHGDYYKSTGVSDRNWWFTPNTGLLILFPSWLEHSTDPFLTIDGNMIDKRISLSFNYALTKCSVNTIRI